MNTNITRIIAAIICSIAFASVIQAQEKPVTSDESAMSNGLQMVDAFGYENSGQIRGRLDNLLKMLSENPAAKGYIINYRNRADENFLKVRRGQINEKFALRPLELTNRITVIDGGYREDVETVLWISIDGKRKPVPTINDSVSASVDDKLQKIDEFGLDNECLMQSRLDILLTELSTNPSAKGYVIIYGGRVKGTRDIARQNRFINTHFFFRSADVKRIEIIKGGNRETVQTELWISTDDNQKPIPTPMFNAKPAETNSAAKKSTRRKSK